MIASYFGGLASSVVGGEAGMTVTVGNLPAEVSSFVDRRRERAELKRLLAASRLVTVTGVGGVGKTRTALRVAAEARGAFPDGVWWTDLSALADGALLAQAVAAALGAQSRTTRPYRDVLAEYLAGRRLLLVLDTCEHLLDACAELVSALLPAARGLHVLATSRQPLGLLGEHVFPIAPLRVPASDAWGPDVGSADYPGLELFVERAQAADAAFAVDETNRAAIAVLCRRLDGIPLAIELAAGRLRTLSAEQLVSRLDDRFRLLARRGRADPARHETMRAAIGWSYDLCTPAERLLWTRMSVFARGFDLAAVERACTDDQLPVDGVADVVAGLVDKSILLREEQFGQVRYRLLDTIREYGQDLLRRIGQIELWRRRHRDHYLALGQRFATEWCGPEQVAWCKRMHSEHANLRAALDFCQTHSADRRAGLELAVSLRYFWVACGFNREGRHYLGRLLALHPAPDPAPDPVLTDALWVYAWLAVADGDLAEVDAQLAQCRRHARHHDDPRAAGWITFIAGAATMIRGDPLRAAALAVQAAEQHRHGGDTGIGLLQALVLQAMSLSLAGHADRAIAVTHDCRALCDQYGERWMRSYSDYVRALAELRRDAVTTATRYARDALRAKRALRDHVGVALSLDLLASAAARHDGVRAARLLGAAHQAWRNLGQSQLGSPDLVAARAAGERQARATIGDRYEAIFAEGLRLDLEAAIAYALDEKPAAPPATARDTTGWAPLTRRERDVAELVADGLTNAQIADQLRITSRTAAAHIEHILAKLDVANRAQIATWVTRRRLATRSRSR
jgi:non-specific serine/threonine protein kinase